MTSRRGVILRAAALVLACVEIPIVLLSMANPDLIGLSATFIGLVGGGHVVAQLALAAVPWQRLMVADRFAWVPRTHVAVNLIALFVSVQVAEGLTADLFWVIALGLVYSGVILSLRDNLVVLVVTSVVLGPASLSAPAAQDLVIPFIATLGLSLLASIGSRVQSGAVDTASDEQARAERTADALRAALRSAGNSVTVDRQRILDATVEGASNINNDQAGVYWLTPDRRHMTYAAARGIPEDLRHGIFDAEVGMKGAAFLTGRTAVMNDYDDHPDAMPEYRNTGLKNAIGSPIRERGEIVGILVGGRGHARNYTPDEVETFEQLAINAGRALEMSEQVDADRRVLRRLQELDAHKRDFVTMVSHELRTPLTVISGLSETLVAHGAQMDQEQQVQLMERINANAQSLTAIVTTLLDTAGIDRGILAPNLEPVDLAALSAHCHARLESLFTDKALVLDVPASAMVRGDVVLLERVVDNLITNALRHTTPGTTVTVAVREDGPRWQLTVADDGPGIADADTERIMERFVRGGPANTRPRGGLGLGLALCQEILGLHQTRLRFTTSDAGTTFYFALPELAGAPAADEVDGQSAETGVR